MKSFLLIQILFLLFFYGLLVYQIIKHYKLKTIQSNIKLNLIINYFSEIVAVVQKTLSNDINEFNSTVTILLRAVLQNNQIGSNSYEKFKLNDEITFDINDLTKIEKELKKTFFLIIIIVNCLFAVCFSFITIP